MRGLFIGASTLACTLQIGCGHEFELNISREMVPTPKDEAEAEAILEDIFPGTEDTEEPDIDEPVNEDPAPEDDCEDTSDLIYMVDRDRKSLHLFDPSTGGITDLGVLDCSIWGTPTSMGVSRDGVGYVRYNTDDVYMFDVETMHCEETSYYESFGAFGMGYATQEKDTWRDDLYLANKKTLARANTSTWTFEELGPLPSQAELTGNAAGELWGFLPLEIPAALVHLNKTNATELQRIHLDWFPEPKSIDMFAFATWGGEFYLFVRTYGLGETTNIYRVTHDGAVDLLQENIGLNIVGAGVSTCAPSE